MPASVRILMLAASAARTVSFTDCIRFCALPTSMSVASWSSSVPTQEKHFVTNRYTRTQPTVNSVTLGLFQFYLGKLAFKHLVGGLTKMLELKYTLFRFTLYKTSSPTPTLDQGTMIYTTKTLGLKEVLKFHPTPFRVYTFFSNKFSRTIPGKIFIFQAMNTTQIQNICHNFLYGALKPENGIS